MSDEYPMDGQYYAKDGYVWKAPIRTIHPNGGMTIAIGFRVCKMCDEVGAEAAETVAELLNIGQRAADASEANNPSALPHAAE